jgi:hypothetical protein
VLKLFAEFVPPVISQKEDVPETDISVPLVNVPPEWRKVPLTMTAVPVTAPPDIANTPPDETVILPFVKAHPSEKVTVCPLFTVT